MPRPWQLFQHAYRRHDMVVDNLPLLGIQGSGTDREILYFIRIKEGDFLAFRITPYILAADGAHPRLIVLAHALTADIGAAQEGTIFIKPRQRARKVLLQASCGSILLLQVKTG